MAAAAKTQDPKAIPRPSYLPEVGRPEKSPSKPANVPAVPKRMYLRETGRRRDAET
jgi:hypothetical protein